MYVETGVSPIETTKKLFKVITKTTETKVKTSDVLAETKEIVEKGLKEQMNEKWQLVEGVNYKNYGNYPEPVSCGSNDDGSEIVARTVSYEVVEVNK